MAGGSYVRIEPDGSYGRIGPDGSYVRIGPRYYSRMVSVFVLGWLARSLYPERYEYLLYPSVMTALAIAVLWALWVMMIRSSRQPNKPQ